MVDRSGIKLAAKQPDVRKQGFASADSSTIQTRVLKNRNNTN